MEKITLPEVEREEQADILVDFLERIKAEQVFSNEESKREFLKNLSFEEFENWIVRVNGILRDIPISKRNFDGKGIAMVPNPKLAKTLERVFNPARTEYVPRQEDKGELLREMFDLVQKMAQEGSNMEDIAVLCSSSVNAIHAFGDGNGRTSRLLNYLLSGKFPSGMQLL